MITHPYPKFNSGLVKPRSFLGMDEYLHPICMVDMITYPRPNTYYSMSVKGAAGSADRMEPAKCSSALSMIYIMAPSHVVGAVMLGHLLRI